MTFTKRRTYTFGINAPNVVHFRQFEKRCDKHEMRKENDDDKMMVSNMICRFDKGPQSIYSSIWIILARFDRYLR